MRLIKRLGIISILIAIIVLLLLGLAYLRGEFDFNPDEDVCEESCGDFIMTHSINKENRDEPEVKRFIEVCNYFQNSWENECLDWRPKTLCEKDPNHEDCECDEEGYNSANECYDLKQEINWWCDGWHIEHTDLKECNKFKRVYEDRCKICLKAHLKLTCKQTEKIKCKIMDDDYSMSKQDKKWCGGYKIYRYEAVCKEKPTPIKINLEKEKCVEWTNVTYYSKEYKQKIECEYVYKGWIKFQGGKASDALCCLKKEPLNPCELGDEDWILDVQYDGVCYSKNHTYSFNFYNWLQENLDQRVNRGLLCELKESREICRKKTEEDMDCEELKEKIKEVNLEGWGISDYNLKYLFGYIDRCGGTK